jgi:hypothetical protein
MELAGIWRKNFLLRYVPITMIQVVSAAATIFVVAAVQAVSGPRIARVGLESAEKSAGIAIQYLREVGESFASATNVANILQNLMQAQVQTRKARRSPGSSPNGAGHIASWQSPNSLPIGIVSGSAGDSDPISPLSWTENIGAPLDGMYANVQQSMGHSNTRYSTLAGALEAPLGYHQPFGDGLGDSLYLPPAVALPGMGVGGFVRSDPVVASDPLMMFRSPQQALYTFQMGMPASSLWYPFPHDYAFWLLSLTVSLHAPAIIFLGISLVVL